MAQVKDGDKVKVHYTGKLDDGTVFDSSDGREPLEFSVGGQQVIPGFEKAVMGLAVGDKKTVRIPAEEAYGPYHEQLVAEFERNRLPEDLEPQVGQQLQCETPDGQPMIVTIAEVGEEMVKLDGNHPLAGKALNFDLELVEIG